MGFFRYLVRFIVPSLPKQSRPEDPNNILRWINTERAKQELSLLILDAKALLAATEWARSMALEDDMPSHKNYNDRMDRAFGSNVLTNEAVCKSCKSAQDATSTWMHSPKYRGALLGDYTHAGLAGIRSASGILYWCVVFVHYYDGQNSNAD